MKQDVSVRAEEIPAHVMDTMCRILLSAIRREQERRQEAG